ncbi:MAG: membrane dipeptidase [Deltaproteobacteria bacterium]|nr:MAG: membrane dipeptidase [Deltaproteobacteria bacterium]
MNIKKHLARLHRQSFMVDAHFDLAYDVQNRRERGEKNIIENIYLPEFKRGGFDLIVSAIFIDDFFLPEMGLRRALGQISCLYQEAEESQGKFAVCRTVAEAELAKNNDKTAIFISLEGADPIQNDLAMLRIFYELGVRGLGLVWSRRNYAADGSFFVSRQEGRKGGLTPFGVELVREAEKLGMFLDVSHLNDEGFWDLMAIAEKPVIASHSNCRKLAGTMRNLTDEQIKALAKTGGVIGINGVSIFAADKPEADICDLVDHVDHIARLTSIEHVGIGFDICHSFTNYLQTPSPIDACDLVKSHGQVEPFTAELIARGYSDDEITKVLGGNLVRVYREILDNEV